MAFCGWPARERELPRGFSGEELKSNLFAVGKDDGSLRTILNRILRNATEEARDGVTPSFPHGSTLGEIFLEECEKLRVSVEDLPDCYHWIRISYERILTESAEGDRARVGRGVGDAASRRCELDRMRKHANAAE